MYVLESRSPETESSTGTTIPTGHPTANREVTSHATACRSQKRLYINAPQTLGRWLYRTMLPQSEYRAAERLLRSRVRARDGGANGTFSDIV